MMKKILGQAALVGALVVPTLASAYVLGPTTPGKWGSSTFGTGATISWSFTGAIDCSPDGGGACSSLSSFMPVGFEAAIEAAFDAWASFADLTFVFVPSDNGVASNASGTNADIRISGHAFDGPNGVLAHGYYPPANGNSIAGDIHFDTAETWKLGFGGPGFDIFTVMAHELGHALGLDHTGVAGSLMNPFYTEAFSGPQADDIAGMQFIYGAPQVVVNGTPEPSTLALLGLAVLSLALRRGSARK
jgi:hypothetical protein